MAEKYLDPNDPYVVAFNALPIDDVMELPLDILSSTITEDFTRSYTEGPIEAYALRTKQTGKMVLWVADGNHRLLDGQRAGRATIETRKVVPHPDNDIRYMWRCEDEWDEV